MKITVWVISTLILLSMMQISFAEEVEYFFPKENTIFSLSIPGEWDVVSSMFPNNWREWRKEDVQGFGAIPFQTSPDFPQEGRLLITLWAFVPDAVENLGVAEQQAGELIAKLIKDFAPAADTWDKRSINGIPFVFMNASGKEKARDEALVNVSLAFFNPEGTHVFLLMATGSPEIFEKYKGEVQKIINSIKPGK